VGWVPKRGCKGTTFQAFFHTGFKLKKAPQGRFSVFIQVLLFSPLKEEIA
jgi:hypothetical protein